MKRFNDFDGNGTVAHDELGLGLAIIQYQTPSDDERCIEQYMVGNGGDRVKAADRLERVGGSTCIRIAYRTPTDSGSALESEMMAYLGNIGKANIDPSFLDRRDIEKFRKHGGYGVTEKQAIFLQATLIDFLNSQFPNGLPGDDEIDSMK